MLIQFYAITGNEDVQEPFPGELGLIAFGLSMRRYNRGLDIDIKDFFDNIRHVIKNY